MTNLEDRGTFCLAPDRERYAVTAKYMKSAWVPAIIICNRGLFTYIRRPNKIYSQSFLAGDGLAAAVFEGHGINLFLTSANGLAIVNGIGSCKIPKPFSATASSSVNIVTTAIHQVIGTSSGISNALFSMRGAVGWADGEADAWSQGNVGTAYSPEWWDDASYASAVGVGRHLVIGSATGVAIMNGVGRSIATSTITITGLAAANGIGQSINRSTATAVGIATVGGLS